MFGSVMTYEGAQSLNSGIVPHPNGIEHPVQKLPVVQKVVYTAVGGAFAPEVSIAIDQAFILDAFLDAFGAGLVAGALQTRGSAMNLLQGLEI